MNKEDKETKNISWLEYTFNWIREAIAIPLRSKNREQDTHEDESKK